MSAIPVPAFVPGGVTGIVPDGTFSDGGSKKRSKSAT